MHGGLQSNSERVEVEAGGERGAGGVLRRDTGDLRRGGGRERRQDPRTLNHDDQRLHGQAELAGEDAQGPAQHPLAPHQGHPQDPEIVHIAD